MRLPRIHADTTALRESRELRSLVLGNFAANRRHRVGRCRLSDQRRFSIATGGLACIAGVGIIVLAFPQLATFDLEHADARLAEATA